MRRVWTTLKVLRGAGLVIGPLLYFGQLALAAQDVVSLGLPRMAWEAIAGTVFFASGAAILWDLHRQNDSLRKGASAGALKSDIREHLGQLLFEGQELQRQCGNEKEPAPTAQAQEWADKTEGYLAENLGESYIARFRSSAGLPMAANSISSLDHRNLWAGLHVRLARLTQFVEELSQ